jgi:hypothetical protein
VGCGLFVDLGCGLGTWSFLAALCGVRKFAVDPDTGERIPHSDEDIFTLPGIIRLGRRHGFRTLYRQAYLGLRGLAGEGLYRRIIAPLNSSVVPGTFLAPTYQLVLQKS